MQEQPGVLPYESSAAAAMSKAEVLALRVGLSRFSGQVAKPEMLGYMEVSLAWVE